MKHLFILPVTLATLLLTLSGAVPALAADKAEQAAGNYQIVKATDNRVWRLNRQTGEIAVCTLDASGAALVCMNSNESVKPPIKDFAALEAARKAAANDVKAQRKEDLSRDLAFLDRMVESFKSIIKAAMEHDQESVSR